MSERSEQRIDISVGVIVKHQGTTEPCLSRNLSQRGMFIATRQRWPVGTIVGLEIVHQDMRISAKGRVADIAEAGLGLEFINADPQVLESIEKLMTRFVPLVADSPSARLTGVDTVDAYWALPADGALLDFLKSRKHKAKLIDLSLDGAAIVSKKPPEVGHDLVLSIENPLAKNADERFVQASAKVVRHTERGFAVQFLTPSTAFRRAVSEIRKAARQGKG